MVLEKQTKELPIAAGIAQDLDPKVVPEGRMRELRNCYLDKPGQLVKRRGLQPLTRAIAGGESITRGTSLASHNDELIAIDGSRAYSYSADGAKSWIDKGPLQFPDLRTRVAIPSLTDVDNMASWDGATAGGISVFVYAGELLGSESLIATVVDAETGVAIIAEEAIGTDASFPFVITTGAVIIGVLYISGTAGTDIMFVPLENIGSPDIAFGTPVTLVNNDITVAAAIRYPIPIAATGLAIRGAGSQPRFAFVYEQNSTGDIVLDIRNGDGTAVSTTATTPVGTLPRACWLSQNKESGDIFVFYDEVLPSRILYYRPFSNTGTGLAAGWTTVVGIPQRWAVAVSGVANFDDSDNMTVYLGTIDDGLPTAGPRETNETLSGVVSDSGSVVTAVADFIGNVVPISEAFTHREKHYFFAINMSGTSPSTGFLIDSNADVALRFFPLAATPDTFDSSITRRVSDLGDGKFMTTCLSTVSAAVEVVSATENAVVLDLAELVVDLDRIGRVSQILANTTSNFGAGALSIYDGSRMAESGFHIGPGAAVNITVISGGTMADGDYEFFAVYFWRDNDGNEHYSRVGDIDTQTLSGGSKALRLEYATYRLSDRPGVKILFYRSLVGATGGPYYIAATADNDASATSVTFDSDLTDAQVADNPTAYIAGGVLDNNAPPSAVHLWDDGQTAFLISADDRRALWVSKPIASRLAIEWSGLLVARMPTGEELTAGGSIDSNVILFGENSIRVLLGTAPSATGAGGYSETRPISSDVGCVDARSVVQFRGGIVFKSRRGFTMLDRSLQVQYIGGPVEDRNDATVLAGLVITRPGIGHIRYLLDTGEVLVWDYLANAWSIFDEPAAVCCAQWLGHYAAIEGGGTVRHKLDRDVYRDTDEPFTWGCRWPWIKASGLSGWQRTKRIHILGEYRSAHSLDVQIYNSYDDSAPTQTQSFASAAVPRATGDPYQARIRPQRQKASAICLDVSVDAPDGEGVRLTSLALDIGAKRGGAKLPREMSG